MITGKTLFHSNVAFVFPEQGFVAPENNAFASLYAGDKAEGARFTDDPVMKTKILILPQLQLRVILEGSRLRIEDAQAKEPQDSTLIKEAHYICQQLFPNRPLSGFGFNFDLVCRSNRVIPLQPMFMTYFDEELLTRHDLHDFGFQCTLENTKEKYTDLWFYKITSPLELAAHLNRHFSRIDMPKEDTLQTLFQTCYNDIDIVVEKLKL